MKKSALYVIVSLLAVGLVGGALLFVPDKNDPHANLSTALEDPTENTGVSEVTESEPETTTEPETTEPETFPYGTYKGVHLPVPAYYADDLANTAQIAEFGGLSSVPVGEKKLLYLTFHVMDGQYESANRILDILKQWGMRAVFFVTGEPSEGAEALYQRIVSEGHSIGNGAVSTIDGEPLSDAEAVNRIQGCSASVKAVSGETPKFFRPEAGAFTMRELYIAKELGMKPIGFSWMYFDQDPAHQMDGEYAFQIMKSDIQAGRIYLLHTGKSTAGALSAFIDYAIKQGYGFGILE